jgi:nucleoside-diphosphate-sugar epimerase
MPTSPAPSKVLVSGANGFIAVWVVKLLLDRGYTVRGTSRSDDKNVHLREIFASHVKEGKLELAVVEDITKVRAGHRLVHTSTEMLSTLAWRIRRDSQGC